MENRKRRKGIVATKRVGLLNGIIKKIKEPTHFCIDSLYPFNDPSSNNLISGFMKTIEFKTREPQNIIFNIEREFEERFYSIHRKHHKFSFQLWETNKNWFLLFFRLRGGLILFCHSI